ncbi:DUF2637 domain-containing protein [Thermomonospora umbrina]|uniref:Uncharacterized protein DUF2637 n=1 Tax=Thermomonospora umbrina TaxID=111806 RepID=A0A3D9SPS0_9ACTN|nr:DUF2637 domain-containing protein [Thermomonospora umbrina]REE96460.1 uncharacterized protein DUF2637 [Thermomonospora umbrina]
MAPDDSSAAPSVDGAGPHAGPQADHHADHEAGPPPRRPTRTQRRLMAVSAGLGVAVLAGGTFVLTYDDLRELALAGGTAEHWAPAYPVMLDALITVTIVSLIAARHARWWSRWLRWALLLVVVAGAAAASVQRAVEGYEPLPDEQLKAGVAIAPYVTLVLSVWLWLAMFRQLQRVPAGGATPVPPPRAALEDRPAPPPEAAEAPPLALPVGGAEEPWLFDDDEFDASGPVESSEPGVVVIVSPPPEVRPEPIAAQESSPTRHPLPEPMVDLPTAKPRPEQIADLDEPSEPWEPVADVPEPFAEPLNDFHEAPLDALPEPVGEGDVDDDPTPPGAYPTLLPTDVELVRGRARPEVRPAATTRPDLVMPDGLLLGDQPLDEDEHDEPAAVVDRAEDPDVGDDAPPGPRLRHLRRSPSDGPVPFLDDLLADGDPGDSALPPPSGSLRSSPLPPQE